jgi:phage-related protein
MAPYVSLNAKGQNYPKSQSAFYSPSRSTKKCDVDFLFLRGIRTPVTVVKFIAMTLVVISDQDLEERYQIWYIIASGWTVVFANRRAEKELEAMAVDIRADFARIIELIEKYGLNNLHGPHIKHLSGKIWEMRMRGRDGIARAAYITAEDKQVAILRCFVKKMQQTPKDEIDLAIKRAKEAGLL